MVTINNQLIHVFRKQTYTERWEEQKLDGLKVNPAKEGRMLKCCLFRKLYQAGLTAC